MKITEADKKDFMRFHKKCGWNVNQTEITMFTESSEERYEYIIENIDYDYNDLYIAKYQLIYGTYYGAPDYGEERFETEEEAINWCIEDWIKQLQDHKKWIYNEDESKVQKTHISKIDAILDRRTKEGNPPLIDYSIDRWDQLELLVQSNKNVEHFLIYTILPEIVQKFGKSETRQYFKKNAITTY